MCCRRDRSDLEGEEVKAITDQEFESWCARIKGTVSKYETTEQRMAVIAGYFGGMLPETALTAAQVAEILKLRNKR